jgi:hypothetical protein
VITLASMSMRKPSGSVGGSSSPPAELHWSQGMPAAPQLHSGQGRSGWASHIHREPLHLRQERPGTVSQLDRFAGSFQIHNLASLILLGLDLLLLLLVLACASGQLYLLSGFGRLLCIRLGICKVHKGGGPAPVNIRA